MVAGIDVDSADVVADEIKAAGGSANALRVHVPGYLPGPLEPFVRTRRQCLRDAAGLRASKTSHVIDAGTHLRQCSCGVVGFCVDQACTNARA